MKIAGHRQTIIFFQEVDFVDLAQLRHSKVAMAHFYGEPFVPKIKIASVNLNR